ncbi:MAG: histidinol dehydrogenase [Oscillospiraceae bacterium]|jgi:histidinol dehydrogenase|nr:histidinol dehydrogenase [Oscillospiraceae bacterium]
MLALVKADGTAERELFAKLKARAGETDARVEKIVQEIIGDVRARGDEALREYSERFDGGLPEKWILDKDDMAAALAARDSAFVTALQNAAENIRDFHLRQAQQSWLTTSKDGVILGQRVRGLARVGLYVPGGTAAYPSSVLMNAIPAKIAGVGELIMVTPPGNGGANPDILAAAAVAGVDKIYLIGGAQAVAALAYGTQSVPQVDKIVGPGNIYVATAKKLVFGAVDIDMIAGPSEVLVVADETAAPRYLAADLLAQAEHDMLASAILLTTSAAIAEQTIAELELQLALLPRREIAGRALADFGAAVVCENIRQCIALADEFAPEHLELCVRDPLSYIGLADNAGSVFLGHHTPESLGDYYAGPNHVLPTGGTARFFSPLGVDSFLKKSSFIYYPESALRAAAPDVLTLARAEGLDAHANAVSVRL